MAHKDPVSPELVKVVLARDTRETIRWLHEAKSVPLTIHQWLWRNPVCVAPLVDPGAVGECWGRTTLEHVKDELRMAKRADSDPDHLVSLCQGHTEDGRKAGRQWNTTKEHRVLIREYLRLMKQRA